MAALAGKKWRPEQHPIRAIIDAVSTADRRTKSRWTRALRFAWPHRREYDGLEDCLDANGGIAGSASKWADLRAAEKTPRGYIRVGAMIGWRISQTPHLTLHALKDELAARGVKVSHNAVWLFLRREGTAVQKNGSPLSRGAPTLHAGADVGTRGRPASIPAPWSSSTRHGSRPAWPRYADGGQRAHECGASRRIDTGAR